MSGSNGKPTRLPWLTRSAYSVGHVLNDLTAAVWFSYLIVYFQKVREMSASHAGILLFVGQGVDAAMTPTVGVLSDKFTSLPYGQRKSWHLFGTLCVALSFPFILGSDFPFVKHFSTNGQLGYFSVFIAIFQIGWASTQVAHLSLIPELTSSSRERDFLNSARYAFTIVASVAVFGLAFGLLQASAGRDVGPSDLWHFALLSYLVVATGLVAATYFHVGVAEPSHEEKQKACGKSESCKRVTWSDWFKRALFYQIGGVYMCARLVVNISQVYLPLFLLDTLQMDKTNIAVAPLTVFIAGLLTTSLQKVVNNAIGRRMTLLLGILVVLGTCVGAHFIDKSSPYLVYGVVIGLGVGGTTMLVTALAMEADLIGDDVEGSAFVYGALSFLDKLSNGIAVLVIQFMAQAHTKATPDGDNATSKAASADEIDEELGPFYRTIMVYVPGAAALWCLAFMISTYFGGGYHEYSKREAMKEAKSRAYKPLLDGGADGRDSPSDRYADADSPRAIQKYGAINPALDAQYDAQYGGAGYNSMPASYMRGSAGLPGNASPEPSHIFLSHKTPADDAIMRTWDSSMGEPRINAGIDTPSAFGIN
ncbi:glycoside-Pentoside-Hexuronide :Cation Symporter family [Thecamonas trahens ATCC 50062]|uniref:Glycoside-Pentoside-Hexuronide: Cation Symporter family n=1 Tax=Thecamonas trahens ATCC 50062 TaxID=461836 RepID=A0A0L0D7Z3_THETB|nr:glycoside-Pentoside-Hexuronide :Cation Symporter family [Thecamonas trahens ATCC 50062]KNC48186.1 glycoside-Pentoside-Hexuronide :Cation Symporter family [Thecamonas trahens ATCC 50062]|eukprot:XP_013758755.1 glycoside-Pentoside-Hexuronide :Cation Symporter family [Thecamonas trahens ATCC 50062]